MSGTASQHSVADRRRHLLSDTILKLNQSCDESRSLFSSTSRKKKSPNNGIKKKRDGKQEEEEKKKKRKRKEKKAVKTLQKSI